MDANKLKEWVLRAEGFSVGFREGYLACAKDVAKDLEKENKEAEESKKEKFVL